jgi:hypothetical protein
MPINAQIDRWLKEEAGYKYHCFISYPRIKDKNGKDDTSHPIHQCARGVKKTIENILKYSITSPKVFLDVDDLEPGTNWDLALKEALCGSLVMVAICATVYYDDDRYCGLEWAAMDDLGAKRLPDNKLLSIVPVLVKREVSYPATVQRPQWVDISGVMALRFRPTDYFNEQIVKVVAHIESVAQTFYQKGIKTDCANFTFPAKSAFAGWQSVPLSPPFYNSSRPG